MSAPPTGVLFYEPRAKPLSVIGLQQPGAYYQFYLTGTTTLAPVYADGLLTTPLSQTPGTGGTTAAGDGRLVPIYLDPSTIYRLQLYNVFGILLEDTDPYVPVSLPSQKQLGQVLYPQTAAEISVGVSPVNEIYPTSPYIDPRRYGAVFDGATNDYASLVAACKVAGVDGGIIFFSGVAAVSSASLSTSPLPLANNTQLLGIGKEVSGIKITGTSVCYVAVPVNASGIRITNLGFTGNSQANSSQVGECFWFQSTNTATGSTGDISIEGCLFTNFKGDYWLEFDNISGSTQILENIWIRDNVFISLTGNARDGTNIGVPAACIMFRGSATNGTALVRNVWVENNYADGTYIKQFCICWEGTERVFISQNELYSFGQSGINLNTGAYTLLAYNNSENDGGPGGSPPNDIYWTNNRISFPLSCGIYTADVGSVFARGNKITGQSDTMDSGIPKAAIAMNAPQYAEVSDNYLDFNYCGIVLFLDSEGAEALCFNNKIHSAVPNSFGIKAGAGTVSSVDSLEIYNNTIDMAGTAGSGIVITATAASGINNLVIRDNPMIRAVGQCINIFAPDSSVPAMGYVQLSNNNIIGNGASSGIAYNNASNSATRSLIQNNRYMGSWASAAALLDLRSNTGVTVKNEEFNDLTSGTVGSCFCLTTAGTQGRMEGIRFNNVSPNYRFATSANYLGGTLPNWAGADNDFVQYLDPTELGTTGSKYIIYGWQWDSTNAAWRQQRSLTGD